ncbi:hypothetical protein DFJ63DRAFT_287808 [Scheffersomyces coipomensis]|uniref:uncharacterized protein n=1 Tax=Scheffersomyces coipomensis TaxID=1788519 RepID=UPI00315CDD19
MNFLTKTLNSLTGNSIPYTLKDKIVDPVGGNGVVDQNSIWTIYNGSNPKTDNSPVSIFEFNLTDARNLQSGYDSLARNAFKKLKLIRFPGVISTVEFIENDNYLYIITEPIVPLLTYLTQINQDITQDVRLYGLYNIAQSLKFINQSCTSLHGNVNLLNSVYVNQQGDWKLFGFEVLTNLQSDPDQPIYRLSSRLPGFNYFLPSDVADSGVEAIRSFPTKFDSYKFGIFLYHILSTKDFNSFDPTYNEGINESSVIGKFRNSFKKLINPKLGLRITVEKFLELEESNFEQNKLITFNKQLEELKFQDDQQKFEFFKYELGTLFSDQSEDYFFPPGILDYKLLPELINQYNTISRNKSTTPNEPSIIQQRQESQSILLNFILKFGVKLPQDQFNKLIKPIIFESFGLADRSIRLALLNHLPNFEQFLTESEVQSRIFVNLINGFQDTNFMIRETTLKSITIIIDKVSVKQVNQELLKVLAKSQMDPKPSIRVNTLILIIKISTKIYKTSKNSVIITALSKSLRDSFTPCKMTALSGFESLIGEFSLDEICSKILGQLAISLMDKKSTKVRNEARRIFKLYLDSVETHSNSLPDIEENENDEEAEFFRKFASTVPPSTNVASTVDKPNGVTNSVDGSNDTVSFSSFGWGVVNRLVANTEVGGQLNNDFNLSTPDLTRVVTPTEHITKPSVQMDSWIDGGDDEFEDDGWGAVDEVEDDPVPVVKNTLKTLSLSESVTNRKPAIKSNTIRTATTTSTRKTSSLKLGSQSKKPAAPIKLNLQVEEDENGWGDDW